MTPACGTRRSARSIDHIIPRWRRGSARCSPTRTRTCASRQSASPASSARRVRRRRGRALPRRGRNGPAAALERLPFRRSARARRPAARVGRGRRARGGRCACARQARRLDRAAAARCSSRRWRHRPRGRYFAAIGIGRRGVARCCRYSRQLAKTDTARHVRVAPSGRWARSAASARWRFRASPRPASPTSRTAVRALGRIRSAGRRPLAQAIRAADRGGGRLPPKRSPRPNTATRWVAQVDGRGGRRWAWRAPPCPRARCRGPAPVGRRAVGRSPRRPRVGPPRRRRARARASRSARCLASGSAPATPRAARDHRRALGRMAHPVASAYAAGDGRRHFESRRRASQTLSRLGTRGIGRRSRDGAQRPVTDRPRSRYRGVGPPRRRRRSRER